MSNETDTFIQALHAKHQALPFSPPFHELFPTKKISQTSQSASVVHPFKHIFRSVYRYSHLPTFQKGTSSPATNNRTSWVDIQLVGSSWLVSFFILELFQIIEAIEKLAIDFGGNQGMRMWLWEGQEWLSSLMKCLGSGWDGELVAYRKGVDRDCCQQLECCHTVDKSTFLFPSLRWSSRKECKNVSASTNCNGSLVGHAFKFVRSFSRVGERIYTPHESQSHYRAYNLVFTFSSTHSPAFTRLTHLPHQILTFSPEYRI